MKEETARAIWEAMTPEQRDALIEAVRTISEKISKCVQEIVDRICEAFPVIVEAMNEYAEETGNEEERRRWKLVKNTLTRYTSTVRRVLPRARSCC